MKIEKYESRVSPSKSAASAYADSSSQVALARENERAGQLVSGIGDAMIKAQALQEQTEASNKASMAMNDLLLRSSQDPEYKNSEKYLKEIDKINAAASKNLTLKASRQAFEEDFFGMSEKARMDIRQDSHKKMISKGISDLGMAIDNNYTQYIREGNTIRQGQLVKRVEFLIDSHVERGYLSPQAGLVEKQKFKNNIGIDKFVHDLRTVNDPESVDGLIEALKSGDYEQNGITIDEEKKGTLIKNAESQKKKYGIEIKRQQRIQQAQNEYNFGQEVLSGKLGLEEVYKAEIGMVISKSYADTLKKYLNSEKTINAKDDPAAYARILQEFSTITKDDYTEIAEKDFGKLAIVRQNIIQAAADGALTKDKSQKWLSLIQPNFQKGIDDTFLQSQAMKRNVFDWMGKWTRQNLLTKDQRDIAKMYLADSVMTQISSEEQQQPVTPERANEIARETLNNYIRIAYPDIVGSSEITNSTATQKTGVRPIHQEPTKAKAAKTIQGEKSQPSEEDILFTAQKYGMTIEEVKKRLGMDKDAERPTS